MTSISQGSLLVFQTVGFQLIFVTLNMFFRENSNSSQKMQNIFIVTKIEVKHTIYFERPKLENHSLENQT